MSDEKRIEGKGFLNKNRKDLCTGKYMDLFSVIGSDILLQKSTAYTKQLRPVRLRERGVDRGTFCLKRSIF